MILWIDAQLPPAMATWLQEDHGVEAHAVSSIGLRNAKDKDIFFAARTTRVVVVTKDRDFVDLQQRYGPPPKIIWVTCGNTSNSTLRTMLRTLWPSIQGSLESDQPLVELAGSAL